MILRGLSAHDLAAKCGVTYRAIENQISLSIPCRTLRWRIENALLKSIWSSRKEFAHAQAVRQALGFDPRCETVPELLRRAKELNLSVTNLRTKPQLIHLFEAHAAVHPSPPKQ